MVTLRQFIDQILVKIDKFGVPNFPMEDMEVFANSALMEWFNVKYAENNTSQKRVDDLRTFLVRDAVVEFKAPELEANLPEDYFRLLGVKADLTIPITPKYGKPTTAQKSKWPFRVTNTDLEGYGQNNVYWRATEHNCYYILYSDKISLYCGKAKIDKLYLDYYRTPKKIELSDEDDSKVLELPEYICNEVTDRIAAKIIEASRDVRFQSFTNDLNKSQTFQ